MRVCVCVYIYIFIYLFIYLADLGFNYSTQDHRYPLQHAGSLVAAYELLVIKQKLNWDMWNLVSWPGSNPSPLHWEDRVLTTEPLRDYLYLFSHACRLSSVWLFENPIRTVDHQVPLSWDSPDKNTGVGCHFILQGIFLTQVSNLHLLCLRALISS